MSGVTEWVVVAVLLICTATDLKWGKVYNAITFPALVLGIAAQAIQLGSTGMVQSLIGVGAALVFFFPLYLLHAFAAGDVKLLMAVGAWTHAGLVIQIGVFAILIGAVVGAMVLLRKLGVSRSLASVFGHLKGGTPQAGSNRMPFAPAFLCAFFLLQIAERMQWNLF